MKSVYLLTLKTLMRSFKTYVFLAIMFLAQGAILTYINFNTGYSIIEYSVEFIEIVLLVALPILMSELFSADKESGFERTEMSLGIPITALVFGKALAAFTVFFIPYIFLFLMPFIFGFFGVVNFSSSFASLGGYLLF